MGVRDSIKKPFIRQRGEKNKEKAEWKAPSQGGCFRVVFPPQKRGPFLDLLESFPDCRGEAEFELLGVMEIGRLGGLEAKFNPFAKPSSPCSPGHS